MIIVYYFEKKRKKKLNSCVRRILNTQGRDYDVTEWHFEAAKAILASFDLVVILEWDETPEQNAVLDKLFQLDTKYPYYNKV